MTRQDHVSAPLMAAFLLLVLGAPEIVAGAPLGTEFTFQGRLNDGGGPANGAYDVEFRLWDHPDAGFQIGTAVVVEDLLVSDGLFEVALDFSGGFSGETRYLEIGVRPGASSDPYTVLSPRQELSATPYALFSTGAPWTGITGRPPGLDDGDDVGTYLPGFGLTLVANEFRVASSVIQQRVAGTCEPGFSIREVQQNGTVVCEQDDGATYTAGDGLELLGTEFRGQGTPWGNVLIVAKSGGDFTSVQAAVDSIAEADAVNPFLVWIAPGVYSETVTTKAYVHLQGAGQGATVITSTAGSSTPLSPVGTLALSSHTSVRDLKVENTGTSAFSSAILAFDAAGISDILLEDLAAEATGSSTNNRAIHLFGPATAVELQGISALAENGNSNKALYVAGGAEAVLIGGSYVANGGGTAEGVHNSGGIVTTHTTQMLAEDGTGSRGLWTDGGSAKLQGGSCVARGGTTAEGIRISGGTLSATQIEAVAEDGSNNYGLHAVGSGVTASFSLSLLIGAQNSVRAEAATSTALSHVRLVGGEALCINSPCVLGCTLVTRGTAISTDGTTCP